jgi:hypothetical protein
VTKSLYRSLEPRGSTGTDLLRLWEWAGQSGRMNPSTANQYRTACGRVLESVPGGDGVDVLSLDVAAAVSRFQRDNANTLSKGTLVTYGSIFPRAVQSLRDFLDEPQSWNPPVAYTKRHRKRVVAATVPIAARPPGEETSDQTVRRIEITLPSGGKAEIVLPDGATRTDIRFLARVLPAYAGDDLA